MTLLAVCSLSCKKKVVEMSSTPPEVVFFKLVDNNGVDLINGTSTPILVQDIILEHLIDGKRVEASATGAVLDNPQPEVLIKDFYNPNIFKGKIVTFYINTIPAKTTLKSLSYLTIKNKGTFTIEVEFLKYGANSTNGKIWVNNVLLRTDRSGGDKPITLVVD